MIGTHAALIIFMLDTRTLLIVLIVSHVLSTTVIYLNWRLSPNVPGVKEWAFGRILVSLALGVFLLRTRTYPEVSIIVGNALLFVGFYTVWLGSRRFLGAPEVTPLPYYFGLASFVGVFVYFTLVENSLLVRSIASSVFNVVYGGFYVSVFLRYNQRRFVTAKMFTIVIGLHALAHAVLACAYPALLTTDNLLDPSIAFEIYFFEGFVLSILSACLYIAMTAEYLNRDLKQQANFDPLTRAVNRRAFLPIAQHAIERRKQERTPISLLMLDLDHFKRVNDTYGHLAGDEVLRQVSTVLHQSVRARDVVCRYGGEEFLVLCPDTPSTDAAKIAERIRKAVEKLTVSYRNQQLKQTVSIGFATFPSNSEHGDLEMLIATADTGLYAAKAGGRNRVTRAYPA